MRISDWSSDVCSSDLQRRRRPLAEWSGEQQLDRWRRLAERTLSGCRFRCILRRTRHRDRRQQPWPGTVVRHAVRERRLHDHWRYGGLVGPQATIRVGDGTTPGGDFTATIAAELTGASQLVKTDLGTLVLSGANRYTGGTAINAGTLSIPSDGNRGDAAEIGRAHV